MKEVFLFSNQLYFALKFTLCRILFMAECLDKYIHTLLKKKTINSTFILSLFIFF